jgi:hypothetical protein
MMDIRLKNASCVENACLNCSYKKESEKTVISRNA